MIMKSSFCFKNIFWIVGTITIVSNLESVESQIIGSSVVTSVSVVLGNDESNPTAPPPLQPTNRKVPAQTESKPELKILNATSNGTTETGVLSVLAALKNIVESEQQKHDSTPTTLAPEEPTTKEPPLIRHGHGDDDDEADEETASQSSRISASTPSVPEFTFPSTMVVKTIAEPVIPDSENNENDTSSAEVHAAIHKLSGAILPNSPGKKPIENIVTDVFTAIKDAKNNNSSSINFPPSRSGLNKGSLPASKKKGQTAPTQQQPSRISPLSVRTTPKPPPTFPTTTQATRKPTTTTTIKAPPPLTSDEIIGPLSSEEVQGPNPPKPGNSYAKKPKPTKSPVMYFIPKKNSTNKNTGSKNKNRPTDFYDDEIFGYDPYQTFMHGVYKQQETTTVQPQQIAVTIMPVAAEIKPKPMLQNLRTQPPQSPTAKPVPHLPDFLHRPRPSHLEYQHSAAETIDPVSGLTSIKGQSAGEKYAKKPDHDPNPPPIAIQPDRLKLQPNRPILSPTVVKNLTDHHHEAHHGGGGHHNSGHGHHGAVEHHDGGHGHGHHGHHGGHIHNLFNQADENRPNFPKAPVGNPGLFGTVTNLDPEMSSFIDHNNRLAIRLFTSVTNPISHSSSHYGNMVVSPFTIISSLGMLFLGARGSTATQLDGLLSLDDMLSFNPHMMYFNISQSFLGQSNTAAAIIRLLIADKEKGDVLDFFKTQVEQFYDTRVEQVDYKYAGHLSQSIINQMIRAQIQRHNYEMINESLPLQGPMSLLTATFFDGQFGGGSVSGTMDFIHLASLGRRLIQVPSLSLVGPFRACYEAELDVTGVEVPYTTRDLSLLLLMPGKPGEFALGGLTSLKSRLSLESWTNLMREFYPRPQFKLQFPKFRTHSPLNITHTIQRFGLTDMFRPTSAKFKGINGLHDLHLDSSLMHFAEFGTTEILHEEQGPGTGGTSGSSNKFDLVRILRPHVREQYGNYNGEPLSVGEWLKSQSGGPVPRGSNPQQPYVQAQPYTSVRISSSRRNQVRQEPIAEKIPENIPVLKYERPFLYVLRHNPTGMILMMGQYIDPQLNV